MMNAAQVIREIDALSTEEQSQVMAHLHRLYKNERFHEEKLKIDEQYLEDIGNGLEETVPHEESPRQSRIEELNRAVKALSDEAKANGLTEELLNDILNEVNPS